MSTTFTASDAANFIKNGNIDKDQVPRLFGWEHSKGWDEFDSIMESVKPAFAQAVALGLLDALDNGLFTVYRIAKRKRD